MKTVKERLINFFNGLNIPFLAVLFIKYITRNHIYIDKTKVSINIYKLLKKLNGYEFFTISTTGALVLIYKEYVVKIPLGDVSEDSLKKNYNNYLMLKQSDFKELVDYDLREKNDYYIMERLESVKLYDNDVKFITKKLSQNGTNIKLKELKDKLFLNLPLLEKIMNNKIYFPLEIEVLSSPMHGDLTKDNIMKNKKDNFVLIDLDRFALNGIKGLDFLHFQIDRYSKLKNIDFFDVLKGDEYIKNELSYIYILYRISQEYKENVVLKKEYYIKAQEVISILQTKAYK